MRVLRPRPGWIYIGHMYGGDGDKEPSVCPWCIADGSAAAWYRGSFNTVAGGASHESTESVERRTPGIETWQDLTWPVCCGEACIFRGQAQYEQLTRTWPQAGAALLATYEPGWLGTQTPEEFLEFFKAECDPGAYAFQCRTCNRWHVEWDLS